MPLVEKHGGLWLDDLEAVRRRPVYERYDAGVDLLAVAVRSPAGRCVASLFEKIPDPQWRLPFWTERRPEALFDDESDAVAHVTALLRTASGTDSPL